MTDESQLDRFGEAVEQKKRESKEASEHQHGDTPRGSGVDGDQESLIEHSREQDVADERQKSSGHGQKTADKWNQ